MGSAKLRFCEFTVSPKITCYDKSGTSWKTQYQSIKIILILLKYLKILAKFSKNDFRFHCVSIPLGKRSYQLEDMKYNERF